MGNRPVSLVTGSAGGIGLAVARELAAQGQRVHVVWRTDGEPLWRRPELLAHMVRWVAGARPHDRQTTLDLQTSLRCSADVAADQLPGEAGLTAASSATSVEVS